MLSHLRTASGKSSRPTRIINALIGPRGDACAPDIDITAAEAERYPVQQIGWLRKTEVDMVSALTLTMAEEAIGAVRAAKAAGIPIVVSFTVETDGKLPTGEALGDAIQRVDAGNR